MLFRQSRDDFSTAWIFTCLGALWLVTSMIVNPVGEFPLNDDWSWSKGVESIVNSGRLDMPQRWPSMTLIAQLVWGTLFCLPFGFSFTALRISGLTAGLAGLFATYALLREIGMRNRWALSGSLLVAFNPLYLSLANTFMTDVPFYAISVWSLLYLYRKLNRGNRRAAVVGVTLAIIAIMIRQLGIVLLIGYGFSYLYKHGLNRRSLLQAGLPLLIAGSVLVLYQTIFHPWFGLPDLRSVKTMVFIRELSAGPLQILRNLFRGGVIVLVYLGVFLSPLLVLTIHRNWREFITHKGRLLLLFFSVLLISGVLILKYGSMPLAKNVWYDFGLGPPTLRDVYVLKLPNLPQASNLVWIAVTIVGAVGGGILFYHLTLTVGRLFTRNTWNDGECSRQGLFMILATAGTYFLLITVAGSFDRYFIFLLPPAMILLPCVRGVETGMPSPWQRFAGALMLLSLGLISICGTHDYLSWNRSRWQATTYLIQSEGISSQQIDGGFEFNGWFNYDEDYDAYAADFALTLSQVKGKSWWWVGDDEYIVAFGHIHGYAELKRFPYTRYLPPGLGYVYALQRIPK